jgi:AcrR family transcriptional regulator
LENVPVGPSGPINRNGAGVGVATLYRNFPGRRELLEALYIDEVKAVCEAAETVEWETPGEPSPRSTATPTTSSRSCAQHSLDGLRAKPQTPA